MHKYHFEQHIKHHNSIKNLWKKYSILHHLILRIISRTCLWWDVVVW